MSRARIAHALNKTHFVIFREHPLTMLISTGITKDYLSLAKAVNASILYFAMFQNKLRKATRFDLTTNYINGH